MSALRFSAREVFDLAVAWVVLGAAFAIFFAGGGQRALSSLLDGRLVGLLAVSLLTAGVGFLLHELGHKVVAVRFGQDARFRADYGMLFLAVMSAMIGFLFAAPGAVHHRGRITPRQHGLIALAGPIVNLGLAAVFLGLLPVAGALGSPFLATTGSLGVVVNVFLAAFNMLPVASLDGKTVFGWSKLVWVAVFVPSAALAAASFLTLL